MAVREAVLIQTEPSRLRMSYEEYLEWADEDTHAEWVDGEVVEFMPAKNVHQSTVGFLYALLDLFVRLFHLGKVRIAPFAMRIRSGRSSREPDILFIAQVNLGRLTEDWLEGAADLVIEVVSDDSVQRDRRDKFKEYREAGILEYWIIDPRPGKQRADFFRLDEQGHYNLFGTEEDERVESAVLTGFWLRPPWLWQADALNPLACCLEIEGVAAAITEQVNKVQHAVHLGTGE